MVPSNDYNQDPFLFSFNFKNFIRNPSEVNKSPNLHKKAKPWRTLVVVVKWRHRANGLIKLTNKIGSRKYLTLLSRSTKTQGNQSFRPEYCNMRTRSAPLVRSSESTLSEERFKITLKTPSEKKTFPWHDLVFKITMDHRKDDKSLSPFSSFLFFSSVSYIHFQSLFSSASSSASFFRFD